MHKRCAVDSSVENAEPKQSPLIERFWRPNTKERPAKFPEHTQKTLTHRPRRIVSRFLFRVNDLDLGHLNCESLNQNPSRIARPRARSNTRRISHNPLRPHAPAVFRQK